MVVILNFKVKSFFDTVRRRTHAHNTVRQSNWLCFFVSGALLTSVDSGGASSVNSRHCLLLNAKIFLHTSALWLLVCKLLECLADFNLAPVLYFWRFLHIDEVVFLDLNLYVIHIVARVALTRPWAFLPLCWTLALVCFHLLVFCSSQGKPPTACIFCRLKRFFHRCGFLDQSRTNFRFSLWFPQ